MYFTLNLHLETSNFHYLCAVNHSELIKQLTPLHGAGEARAIVRMVMEERFGLSQTDLLLGKDTTLSPRDREDFEKIASRLLAGEPVQHILGFADFHGHRFHVTPDVLIPRPETEQLVDFALPLIKQRSSHRILDLCTGSGCIAISLALAVPNALVTAIDISATALTIARENALTLGAKNISFFQQDILDPSFPNTQSLSSSECDEHVSCSDAAPFHLLTANPPYVRTSEAASMSPTVLEHEPSLALFVPDDDPLLFYRAIARIGRRLLTSDGHILVELNTALADATRHLFLGAGYEDVRILNDQFGRPRFLFSHVQEPHR